MSINNFKVTTVTMCCDLSNQIDLDLLFPILPIHPVFEDSGQPLVVRQDTEKKKKITFYGTNDVIVSARYNSICRGVRKEGKQLHKVISLDLQISNKNIHLKLSKSKIQLTGAPSREMGVDSFSDIVSIVNSLQVKINYFKKYSPSNNQLIKNLILFSYEKKRRPLDEDILVREYLFSHLSLDGKDPMKQNKIITKNLNKFAEVISFFSIYTDYQENTVSDISRIVDIFIGGKKIFESERPLNFKSVKINNLLGINSIKTDKRIPIIHIMCAMMKYYKIQKGVEEPNRFHIKIPTNSSTPQKLKFHKFNFFGTGTIRQHSPSEIKESLEIQAKVIKITCDKLRELGIKIL